jgi:hypothetical protein
MSFKEQFGILNNDKRPDAIDEKILRKTIAPGCGGQNWEQVYIEALRNNEDVGPGENFGAFVARKIAEKSKTDKGEPTGPSYKQAA